MKIVVSFLTLAALAGASAHAQTPPVTALARAAAPVTADPARSAVTLPIADPEPFPAGLLPRTPIDDALIAARKAMLESDLDRFDRAVLAIPPDHPLHVYGDYWRLRILLGTKRLEGLTGEADQAVRAFLARHPGTIVADLLRRDWLLALGRRGDWAAFDAEYPKWQVRDDVTPDCYAQLSLLSRLEPGRPLPARAAREARALVMRPVALNRACSDLFDALVSGGHLRPEEVRQRLMRALEANAPADVRLTAALLGFAPGGKDVEQALTRPAAALKTGLPKDLRMIALVRLARADPAEAAERLRASGGALTVDDRRFVWAQIAAAGMRRLLPDAHAWAREAAGAKISDQTRVWLARAALRPQDWTLLRATILAMDADTRAEPTWTYWLGRAEKALGQTAASAKRFESLAARQDYYGKLANEELGRRSSAPPRPEPAAADQVAAFDSNPGFARALAFYSLGMRFEGNREWNFQMRERPEAELRAAATWAMQRRLLDRAINADERIRGKADFAMRFPTPFSAQLIPITQQQNLDTAWVYGLIRQESRFIMDARSHVGASGLMQLMPATARWVAKKLGRKDFLQKDLNELQTNLEFGSFYLKSALDDLDGSPVLASAGYNAGPGRARTWRGALSAPVEGAIFAEIIPFNETRGYVKNVLSNATDYAALFSGEPQSLKARLGVVEPKAATPTLLP